MNKVLRFVTLICAIFTLPALAQQIPEFEQVLIPLIVPDPIDGAYNSRWVTELHGYNGSTQTIDVYEAWRPCDSVCVLVNPAPPGWVFLGYVYPAPRAALIYLPKPLNETFTFNLRIRDLSRQALTWGTELPVVRERDAVYGKFTLLNVPTDDRFRWHLRLYGFDGQPDAQVGVRISELKSGKELATLDVVVSGGAQPNGIATMASSAELLSTDPRLAGLAAEAETLRIEIDPVTEGRYWAFVSVTNNETQHVTVVTPQYE